MILGGVVISALGAASTQFIEEKPPTLKSLSRDFIIGSVMMAMIIQLLPESSTSIIQAVLSIVPLSLLSLGSAKEGAVNLSTDNSSDDVEVKVGVPRF
jgi:hypothetical protein